ncbi:MAG: metal ABC transporter permease [Actinomycetes bacterium]|jgi:manganese/iron transport system permease protein/iron/zinc/copper transport system permease protein
MNVIDSLVSPLTYSFFDRGLIVATISGALLGLIGVYITLRGMSYIGHGLSHAVFGGFAAAQLFAAQFYVIGAGLWGVASALAINSVSRRQRIGADAAIGVITTGSFALGVALLSKFGARGPSFDSALFGSILGISTFQIWGLIAVGILTVLMIVFRYRALMFTTFDPDVADASGVNVSRTDAMLMIVLSLTILATLTVIGVTLVAAMLVIPAVVARMITSSFSKMLIWSAGIGSLCGFVGMYLSYYAGVPSGTMIVLTGSAVFALALVVRSVRTAINRRRNKAAALSQAGQTSPAVSGKKMPVAF